MDDYQKGHILQETVPSKEPNPKNAESSLCYPDRRIQNILQFNVTGLEKVLEQMSSTLQQHEANIRQPPWLEPMNRRLDSVEKLESRVNILTNEVLRLQKTTLELSTPREPISEETPIYVNTSQNHSELELPAFMQYKFKTEGKLSELLLGINHITKMMSSALSVGELEAVQRKLERDFQNFDGNMEQKFLEEQRKLDERLSEDLEKLRAWLKNQETLMEEREQAMLSAFLSKSDNERFLHALKGEAVRDRERQDREYAERFSYVAEQLDRTSTLVNSLQERIKQGEKTTALQKLRRSFQNSQRRSTENAFRVWVKFAGAFSLHASKWALKYPGLGQGLMILRDWYHQCKMKRLAAAMAAWGRFLERRKSIADRFERKLENMVRAILNQRYFFRQMAFTEWRRQYIEQKILEEEIELTTVDTLGTLKSKSVMEGRRLSLVQEGRRLSLLKRVSLKQSSRQQSFRSQDSCSSKAITDEIKVFGNDVQGALLHLAKNRFASNDMIEAASIRIDDLLVTQEEILATLETLEKRTAHLQGVESSYVESSVNPLVKMQNRILELESKINIQNMDMKKQLAAFEPRLEEMEYKNSLKAPEIEKAVESLHVYDKRLARMLEFQGELYEKLEQKDMEILAQQNNLSHVKATTEQLCERVAIQEKLSGNNGSMLKKIADWIKDFEVLFQSETDSLKASVAALRISLASTQQNVSEEGDAMNTKLLEIQDQIAELTKKLLYRVLQKPEIEPILRIASNFEGAAMLRTYVPPISQDEIPNVAIFCQEMALYIAELADHEALGRSLGGVSPEELPFLEGEVESRRQDLIEIFFEEYSSRLNKFHESPGALRSEARRIFRRKLKDCLDMALSKYDQILLPAYTRFESRKPPVCIACDRPVTGSKQRRKERLKTNQEISKKGIIDVIRDDEVPTGGQSSAATLPDVTGYLIERKADGGGKKFPLTGPASSSSPAMRNAFVLRGGFKMSKQELKTGCQAITGIPTGTIVGSVELQKSESAKSISESNNVSQKTLVGLANSHSRDNLTRPKTAQSRMK